MNDRFGPLLLVIAALSLAHVMPDDTGSFGVSQAQAQDDDDDGGGGDDDDDDDDGGDDDDDDDDFVAAPPPPPPPPEFVVALPDAGLLADIEALGYVVVESERLDLIDADIARLQPPGGVSLEAARTQIAGLSAEALLDLNALYRPNELPCGPQGCAAFQMIGWSSGAACPVPAVADAPAGLLIGMIDTGVNSDHPSMPAQAVETVPVIGEGRSPASAVHGTAIALLLSGAPDSRTPGLLPGARLLAAEAFHVTGAGDEAADVFDIVRAMGVMAEREVDVVNMSFSGEANTLLERALAALTAQGIPVATAVGNAGPFAPPLYPAAYPDAIAVTAIDREQSVFRQANSGAHVDFAAPGVNLWTAASISGGRARSGTSYAVPFVTAALAVERAAAPDLTPTQLEAALAERAVDLGSEGRDETFGWGLVQLSGCAASEEAGSSTTSGG